MNHYDTDDQKLYTSLSTLVFGRSSRECMLYFESEWYVPVADFLEVEKYARTNTELYYFHEAYFLAMQEASKSESYLCL